MDKLTFRQYNIALICFVVALGIALHFSATSVQAQTTIESELEGKKGIYILGDSKAKHYDYSWAPREGWGQELAKLFNGYAKKNVTKLNLVPSYSDLYRYTYDDLFIENWSKGGGSLREYKLSGRTDAMLARVREKDYVLICLGHNDARRPKTESLSTYKKDLKSLINQVLKRKATPIVLTTPPQYFRRDRRVILNKRSYWKATKKIAKDKKVTCIDLNQSCTRYFNSRGLKFTKSLFVKYNDIVYPKTFSKRRLNIIIKNGSDPTHFDQTGAKVIAKMIVLELQHKKYFRNRTKTVYLKSYLAK